MSILSKFSILDGTKSKYFFKFVNHIHIYKRCKCFLITLIKSLNSGWYVVTREVLLPPRILLNPRET